VCVQFKWEMMGEGRLNASPLVLRRGTGGGKKEKKHEYRTAASAAGRKSLRVKKTVD